MWADEKFGFALEPLHRGFIFTTPVQLYIVENGQAQRLIYDRADYDFGDLQRRRPICADLGFSGVRVLTATATRAGRTLAIFQGATFFRSLARGQRYGVNARGLSIRTADPQGEEFPLFRALWIEKPSPASTALTIHALLDSASLTGAFHFTLRPGDATIIDTELTLVARVAVDHLGLGAMTATYLFGALDHRHPDDVRPAVYDIGGLQIFTGAGEWLWRPIASRDTLQISAFGDVNPRGFGLLQRARAFDDFDDDDARWELRPSLWIEPISDWGEGEVILLEIPPIPRTTTTSSRNGGRRRPRRGRDGLVRLSPVLVLDAAGAPTNLAWRPSPVRAPARSASAGVSSSNSSPTCSPTR